MGRYIVLYSAPISVKQRFAQATPEEAMAGMHMWIDWAKKLGKSLLDPGRPFGRAVKVTAAGTTSSDSPIVGMSILEAPSMDEALTMVKDHHHLRWAPDCEITLLEEMPIPELQG
ncbi:MAG: hypothetical protein JWR51_1692 [Devosia sp.]|uniref:hypothetical protein n=1 Tax=Devosia sp. TaxID=1871048 RepID=UPI00260AE6C3|nr:hypothetical protein [Devosia sp.]MDB5528589.1 hypothetical protein [Devosia sp.]